MANPLSSRGWSDRDYAAAIGTLMGEAAAKGNLRDYQAIADVIANRAQAGVYGKSVAGITMNPGQFSTWSPKEKSAYQAAVMGFTAALNPSRIDTMPKAMQDRFSKAQQAVADVMVTGKARGLTQGATAYHNASVTAKNKTDGWHNQQEEKYGAVTIGAHTFTGQGFRPDDKFDPVTYNGQLAAPPAAEPFFGDLGAPPIGQISSSSIPDITPASAGFSLDGATLPDGLSLDFGQFNDVPDFSGITQGTAFDQFGGFTPSAQSPVDFSDVDLGSYPDISQGMYSGIMDGPTQVTGPTTQAPAAAFSADPLASREQANFTTPSTVSGFSAGFDEGPYGVTPDFAAPSLEARNAMDRFENTMEVRTNPSFDMTNEAIAQNVMNELGPQMATPQAPIAPSPVAATPSFAAPNAPIGDISLDAVTVTAPRAPSAPAASLPSATPQRSAQQEQIAKDYDLSSFSLPDVSLPDMGLPSMPDLSVRGIGSSLGLMDKVDKGFMDAMANPSIAQGWSPGFLDTRAGQGLMGAGMGFLTGGPIGAVTQGLWSGLGIGDMISNEFDRYANAYANLSPVDFAAYGLDGNWTDREPTMNTGMTGGYDGRGGGHVGDGSFSDSSGRNDNNPQGIL